MREGWGWEMRGLSSSPGDAGGVGDVSIVTVGEGGLGVGGMQGLSSSSTRVMGS